MTQMFDPIAHADHFFGQLYKGAEAATIERDKDRAILAAQFVRACAQGDANALAPFAPMVRDHTAPRPVDSSYLPHRFQTVSELMVDSMDYRGGPAIAEAMQLILNIAYGQDTSNAPLQARALISRMAESFAKYNHED